MNLFQIVLVVVAAATVIIWAGSLPAKIDKLKHEKGEYLVSDKMLSEDEKQKISDEDFINFVKGVKNRDGIYTTAYGTFLNPKPHTFKDFINNQKLPSKLELIQEILADNNLKISDIIQKIEDNAPYPPDTLVHWESNTLSVTPKQIKMINAIHFDDGNLLLMDNSYPLYIKFETLNTYTRVLYVTYLAGDRYDDKNPHHERHTRPTKH